MKRSFVFFPPHEAHQAIQLHTNPSVKSRKVKRENAKSEKVRRGERAQPFKTASIIQPQVLHLVELRCSRSCSLPQHRFPLRAKNFHGSKEKPGYQLKGLWHDQLSTRGCKNKGWEILKENIKAKRKHT